MRFDPSKRTSTPAERPGAPEREARNDSRKAGRLRCSMLGSNHGEVLDVSATGARILLRKNPDIQAGDVFEIDLETNGGAIHTRARTVWIRLNAEKKFEMGVEFVGLEASDKKRLLETVLHPTRAEALRRGWNVVGGADDSAEEARDEAKGKWNADSSQRGS